MRTTITAQLFLRRSLVTVNKRGRVQLNVRVTLSAGKGAFGVIPEWVQGVAAGQMDESWINKHGQLDSKGGPWQNAFPKSRSLPGAKQV